MNVILERLGDPIWQIGGGSLLLATLALTLVALRRSDVHLSLRHQRLFTRMRPLVCLSLFLVLTAGVVLSRGANAVPS